MFYTTPISKKIFVSICCLISISTISQNVGINSTGVNPLASAMLDVSSDDKGILVPRVNIVDLTTAAPVTSPEPSLLVYNTNIASGVGYYYWDATKWNRIYDQTVNSQDSDWFEVGGTTPPNAITDDMFTQGKVGIAVPVPLAVLDIVGDVAINRTEMGGGNRAWMVDGVRIGAAGSDNAYFGLKDEGANDADAVIAWGDDLGDHLRFINTRSGGPLDGVEYMRIEDGGHVGIGNPNPDMKLAVLEAGSIDYIARFHNSGNSGNAYQGIRIGTSEGGALYTDLAVSRSNDFFGISVGQSAGDLVLNSQNDAHIDLAITRLGNVGVGEITPGAKLDVNGDLRIQTIVAGTSSNDYLVTDATGVVKTAPLVTNVTDGGANLRMYTGHTPADGTGWLPYAASANGIYIEVDMSACGFTSPPQVYTTMGGGSGSWVTTGSNSTYGVTATTFFIYLNYMTSDEMNSIPTPALADTYNWYINWFAIGN